MWIVLIKLSPVIQSTTITSRLFTPPAKHIPSNYNYSRLIQPWDKEKQFNGIDSGGVRSNTCCLPLGEHSEEKDHYNPCWALNQEDWGDKLCSFWLLLGLGIGFYGAAGWCHIRIVQRFSCELKVAVAMTLIHRQWKETNVEKSHWTQITTN